MAMKSPRKNGKQVRIRKNLKEYSYLGCPLTRNRSPWCFRLCEPKADGTGFCGRVAPHGFKSRIQQGIEDYKRKKANSSNLLRYQKPAGDKDS